MEDRDIISLTSPIVKVIVDTFVKPKLDYIQKKFGLFSKNLSHDYWSNQFENYLIRSYLKFSVINTLVFQGEKKRLKELYVPLTLVVNSNEGHAINKFQDFPFTDLRKVLIMDTAGMGKSTLLKFIFLSIVEQNAGIPIIIELRRLTPTHTLLDNIIEQLNPLDNTVDKEFILRLVKRGDFIFMLDGYDEISSDHKQIVARDIEGFIDKAGENIFIVTSRPEGSLGSFSTFKFCSLKPLDKEEAYTLLRKYDSFGQTAELLIAKLEEPMIGHVIGEFLTNPLLVSLLFTGFEYKNIVPFKKPVFYRQVFDSLFEAHDLSKGNAFIRRKYCTKLDIEDYHRLLRYIGYQCLRQNKVEFNRDEIMVLIIEAKKFAVNLDFAESDFLKDITISAPLLIVDGVYFKWAHKSIQEYFAANFIFLDSKHLQEPILTKIYQSKDIGLYRNVLDIYASLDYKSFKKVIISSYLKDYYKSVSTLFSDVDVPDEEKDLRRTLYFHYQMIMARVKFKDGESADFDRFFEIIRSLEDGVGVSVTHVKPFDRYDHIKVAKVEKKHGVIFEIFSAKGREPFLRYSDYADVTRHTRDGNTPDKNKNPVENKRSDSILINLYRTIFSASKKEPADLSALAFDTPLVLNEDAQAFYNNASNFSYVNEILAEFISHWYVDSKKGQETLAELAHDNQDENLLLGLT